LAVCSGPRRSTAECASKSHPQEVYRPPHRRPRSPTHGFSTRGLRDGRDLHFFAFSTATFSGRSAVSGLGSQIVTMRTARPGASPVVELYSAPYKRGSARR
jgi:hypothetical protein